MAAEPRAGEQAPDFELPGSEGPFKLSDHRGERVVLLFYPGDNTLVCKKQFCSYRDRPDDFAALNATVVGISTRTWTRMKASSRKTASRSRCWQTSGRRSRKPTARLARMGTKRAVVIIDGEGIVRYRHDHRLGLDYQSVDDLRAALDALPAAV